MTTKAEKLPQQSRLLIEQSKLQSEAQEVIKKLKLTELLSTYGAPVMVGSASLGLMTWKDIDFSVLGAFDETKYLAIVKTLFLERGLIDLTLEDTRKNKDPQLTSGMYIGMKYTLEDSKDPWEKIRNSSKGWKIDMWFVNKSMDEDLAIKKTDEIRSLLNEPQRATILEIKQSVASNPLYRKRVFAVDIYNAVLKAGVTNLNQFQSYLQEQGRTL
jgi:hypothetical protein